MKIKFKSENIQIDNSWEEFFTEQKEALSQIESFIGDDFTPKAMDVFKIFKLPIKKVKHVIVGQDPYPQPGVATGRSFEVAHSKWNRVNVSLKAILVSIYYHSTSTFLDINQILDKIENGSFEIDPPNTIFKNMEQQKGVFFLNRSLTSRISEMNSHKEIWSDFTSNLIKYLDRNTDCNWLLWGGEARSLEEYITRKQNIKSAIHPVFWFYAETEIDRINRLKEFSLNSGFELIINQ